MRNVPALGCGDQLSQLFSTYGEIEEYDFSPNYEFLQKIMK